MLTVLIMILAVVALAIFGILALAVTKPDTFRVARSATIKAPPERIFALISNMRQFNMWNPYERKDPGKGIYRGPSEGKGAAYAWDSKTLGQGSMEIVDLTAPSQVKLRLDFVKPFEAHNTADFTIEPKGDATQVTWAMQGPTPFLGKIMHVFINVDRMVGQDFENGLGNLKTIAEAT
jgi:uncharacterized protein YndB with AHSA1/START domain